MDILPLILLVAFIALRVWREVGIWQRSRNASQHLSEAQKKPPPDEPSGRLDFEYGGERLP